MGLKPEILPDTPEARGKRIKHIRVNLLDISRPQLCKDSSIGTGTLKGWEVGLGGGVSKIGAERLVNRLKELDVHCSVNWILHGLGQKPKLGSDTYLTQSDEEKQIIDELLLFRRQEDAIDMKIIDDTMTPSFYPGNYVAGIIAKNIDRCIGKACIVVTNNNEKMVRILEYGDESGQYKLVCENSRTDLTEPSVKITNIVAAAPIIFIRRKNPDRD